MPKNQFSGTNLEATRDEQIASETPEVQRLRAASSIVGIGAPLSTDEALRILSGAADNGDGVAAELIESCRDWENEKDPFDELLVVQAQELGMKLLTRDSDLEGHPLAHFA